MHGDAHIEGLQATPGRVSITKAGSYGLQNLEVRSDGAADNLTGGIFEDLADPGAARNLAGAGMPGVVGQQHYIAGEVGRVGPAQVQQHAVAAGNRNHTHAGYTRRGTRMARHYRSISDLSGHEWGRLRKRTSGAKESA